MGVFDKVGDVFRNRRELSVLMVGLDHGGKSTIINNLKPLPERKSPGEVQPTIGMVEEMIRLKTGSVVAFDMSGQGRYRSMWERRLDDCQAIVFVVDSSDRLRLIIAKEELYILGNHATVRERRLPFLFLINKLDALGAMSPARIANALAIDRLFGKKIPWKLIGCNALTGVGLNEGFEWLIQFVNNLGDDGMPKRPSQHSPSTPPIQNSSNNNSFDNNNARPIVRKPTLTTLVISSTSTTIPAAAAVQSSKMKKSASSVLANGDENSSSEVNASKNKAAPDAAADKNNNENNTAGKEVKEKRKFTSWFRRSSSSKP